MGKLKITISVLTFITILLTIFYTNHVTFVEEESMVTLGFPPGTKILIMPVKCEVGDICVFSCIDKKCKTGEDYIKLVEKKEGVKYWMIGREDKWKCDNDICSSFDSGDYGWVENGEDIKVLGVAYKL